MHDLRTQPTPEASVALFWDKYGRAYLESPHVEYRDNDANGCFALPFEGLIRDFNGTAAGMLSVFGADPAVVPALLGRLARHDRSALSNAQLASNAHVASARFEPFTDAVAAQLVAIPAVAAAVAAQRAEMGSLRRLPPPPQGRTRSLGAV